MTHGIPHRATTTSPTTSTGEALTINSRSDQLSKILRDHHNNEVGGNRFRVRKNAQQTLLYLSPIIAQHNQRFYTRPATGPSNTGGGNQPEGPLLKSDSYTSTRGGENQTPWGWKSGYRNICPILSGKRDHPAVLSGKSHPDVSITQLVGATELVNRFFTFELTAAQQAVLVPKIEIFKLDYVLEEKNGKKTGKIDREQTPTRRPIHFDNALTHDEISSMLTYGGNVGSAGIESFSWALKGVNPAEVDSNIEARLKVYFNNINVFNNALEAIWAAAAAGPPRGHMGPGLDVPASFIDLITFAPPTTESRDLPCLETYDPYFFEIEVRLGWSFNLSTDVLSVAEKEYIKEQEVYLYLTLTDHKFDFKEDGSATLEVNYRARSTMNAREHDLLAGDPEIERATDDLQIKRESAAQTDGEDSTVDQRLIEDQEEVVARALTRNYTRIIKSILAQSYVALIPNSLLLNNVATHRVTTYSNPGGAGAANPWGGQEPFENIPQTAPRVVLVEGEAVSASPTAVSTKYGALTFDQFFQVAASSGDETPLDTQTYWEGTVEPMQSALSGIDLRGTGTNNKKITVTRKGLAEEDVNQLVDIVVGDNDDHAAEGDNASAGFWNRGEEIKKAGPGESLINFLYLGDILEVLLETKTMVKLFRQKKFAIVTTDFRFKNYFKLIQMMSVSYSGAGPGSITIANIPIADLKCKEATLSPQTRKDIYSCINMANIPINLEIFLDFFTHKVVSTSREAYYLEDFLNDLFNSLIKPMLGEPGILGVPIHRPTMIGPTIDTDSTPGKGSFLWNSSGKGYQGKRSNISDQYYLGSIMAPANEDTYNYITAVSEYTERRLVGPRLPGQLGPVKLRPAFPPRPSEESGIASVKILGISLQFEHLNGNYLDNLQYGINNFIVGLDRGIVKGATFERVDQPYLREARTAKAKNFGVGQLRELYNVKLTLYGNNLLRPGQIIYVEPNSVIFGRPVAERSAARILGLGGYHLVIDVTNEISRDGWETTVKALHMAMPAMGGSARPSVHSGVLASLSDTEMNDLQQAEEQRRLNRMNEPGGWKAGSFWGASTLSDDEIRAMGVDPATGDVLDSRLYDQGLDNLGFPGYINTDDSEGAQ